MEKRTLRLVSIGMIQGRQMGTRMRMAMLVNQMKENTHAPTGFVVVYPTGLVDRGSDTSLAPSPLGKELLLGRSYHWEDGRSPSQVGCRQKRE